MELNCHILQLKIVRSWSEDEIIVMTETFKFNNFACIWKPVSASMKSFNLFSTFFYTLNIFWKKIRPIWGRMTYQTTKTGRARVKLIINRQVSSKPRNILLKMHFYKVYEFDMFNCLLFLLEVEIIFLKDKCKAIN